jgi:ATP-dependent RNA circularization protein (DNA/RNA ligase family)
MEGHEMQEYPKIPTVYLRNPATNYKTLLEGEFASPELEYLKDCLWAFTEKVDGTNIRVLFQEELFPTKGTGNDISRHTVRFFGRSNNAQIPPFLLRKLQELFPLDKFKKLYPDTPMTLYGEGYGAKIQRGGGNYISDGVDFILFDVMINGNWLEIENVLDIADKLGIYTVPIIAHGQLSTGIHMVRQGFASMLRATPPEGLVMKPVVELQDRRGRRIITKLKTKDFPT